MPEDSTEPAPETGEATDVRTIRQLVRLMQRYDLTAIDLIEGPTKIRLRRRGSEPTSAPAPPPLPVGPAAAPASPPAPSEAPAAPSARGVVVESPMVGTFYAASAPDAPPYVTLGSVVQKDSTVGVIEAMKVFTEIPAGVAGTIIEVLVKDKQPVEFGQPLFRVNPS